MEQSVPVLDSGVVQGQVLRTVRDAVLVCHEVLYPGKTRLARHAHENAFVALSLAGEYSEQAAGREFQCVPRSVVYHPPGEEHVVQFGEQTARCFVLEFDVDEIQRRFGAAVPRVLLNANGSALSALMARLYAELHLADGSSSLAMQGLLLQILALAARTDDDEVRSSPRWMARIDEVLHERFRARLTLDEIAAEVGIAPPRVSAVFRRVRGRSLADEQRRLRTDFACERLRDPRTSLAEIAAECGFADQPHFTRTFKRLVGMTPAQYRGLFG